MPIISVDGVSSEITQEQLDVIYYRPPPTEGMVRQERNNTLKRVVDPIAGNALRWAALTSEQRTAWATYRTALLDVPAQAGFPSSITWPTAP